jgi:hypothetical protein
MMLARPKKSVNRVNHPSSASWRACTAFSCTPYSVMFARARTPTLLSWSATASAMSRSPG